MEFYELVRIIGRRSRAVISHLGGTNRKNERSAIQCGVTTAKKHSKGQHDHEIDLKVQRLASKCWGALAS